MCDEKCCEKKINFEFHKLLLPLLLPKRHNVGIKKGKFIGVFLPPDIIFQHIFTLIFCSSLFPTLKDIERIWKPWICYEKWAYLCPTVTVISAKIINVASTILFNYENFLIQWHKLEFCVQFFLIKTATDYDMRWYKTWANFFALWI